MFWWFERKGDFLRLEVLHLAADKYELRVIYPDATERVETFATADDLAARQQQLEHAMADEGWTGPHGWVM